MTNITLFLHVIFAAGLIGMILPEVFIKRHFNRSKSDDAKLALAALHLRLMQWGMPILLLIVLTGIGRTMELRYPWFDFSLTFWLAVKQIIGFLLLLGYVASYASIRSARKLILSESETAAAKIAGYVKVRGKAHATAMTALLLAFLGVTKLSF